MKTLNKMTVKELKNEAKSLHQQIYQIGCYGTKDLMLYNQVINELEDRGVTVTTNGLSFN
jgi:peroxiredoxin family protein